MYIQTDDHATADQVRLAKALFLDIHVYIYIFTYIYTYYVLYIYVYICMYIYIYIHILHPQIVMLKIADQVNPGAYK